MVGEAGLLVDPIDEDAIASGLLSLVREPDLRQRLSRLGLARAATFTWERAAEETLATIERAAK